MDPLYLHALMHGEIVAKKKDVSKEEESKKTIEIELEKLVQSYVDNQHFEPDPDTLQLLSIEQRRQKLKCEITEALKMTDQVQDIQKAIDILFFESLNYVSKEASDLLISEFSNAEDYISEIDAEKAKNANPKTLAKISDESMQSIVDIAFAKFAEERNSDSESLFILLTILQPDFSEYWLRRGVLEQLSGKFEVATLSFAAASELDPNLVVSRLLSAECYLNIGKREKAKEEFLKAKTISENVQIDQEIVDLLNSIKSKINSPH